MTKDVSQPLDKRCSKASFSVVSQIYAKMWKPMFTKFFLLLETKRLCHNLLINGVQSADPRLLAQDADFTTSNSRYSCFNKVLDIVLFPTRKQFV